MPTLAAGNDLSLTASFADMFGPGSPPTLTNDTASKSTATASTKLLHVASQTRGFTLIELMVVLAIVALASALVSANLPDSGHRALMRDAQRLSAQLEVARAQSRAAGLPIHWRTTEDGFVFEGLPTSDLAEPRRWLDPGTRAQSIRHVVTLGPEPIIDAQTITLHQADDKTPPLYVGTAGLAPFEITTSADVQQQAGARP